MSKDVLCTKHDFNPHSSLNEVLVTALKGQLLTSLLQGDEAVNGQLVIYPQCLRIYCVVDSDQTLQVQYIPSF